MTTAGPLPTLQVLVAFTNNALDDPTGFAAPASTLSQSVPSGDLGVPGTGAPSGTQTATPPLSEASATNPYDAWQFSCVVDATHCSGSTPIIQLVDQNGATLASAAATNGTKTTVVVNYSVPASGGPTSIRASLSTNNTTIASGQYLLWSSPQLTNGWTYVAGSGIYSKFGAAYFSAYPGQTLVVTATCNASQMTSGSTWIEFTDPLGSYLAQEVTWNPGENDTKTVTMTLPPADVGGNPYNQLRLELNCLGAGVPSGGTITYTGVTIALNGVQQPALSTSSINMDTEFVNQSYWNWPGSWVASNGVVAGVWTDITKWVKSYSLQGRGRQHDLDQGQAGTATILLDNADGRFGPWNTASPYSGNLLPRRWVQVRAVYQGVTYYRFTGHVTAWNPVWSGPATGDIQLQAADPFRLLTNAYLTADEYRARVAGDGATSLFRFNDPQGSTVAVDTLGLLPDGSYEGEAAFPVGVPLEVNVNGVQVAGQTAQQGAFPFNVDLSTSASVVGTGTIVLPAGFKPPQGLACAWEFWVNGAWVAQQQGIVPLYADGSFVMGILPGGYLGAAWSTTTQVVSAGTVPSDGQWHHVVFYALDTGYQTSYIDGQQSPLNSVAQSTTQGLTLYNYQFCSTGQPVGTPVIGLANNTPSNGGGVVNVIPFAVANAASYPGGLSASQVANHWQAGSYNRFNMQAGSRIGECLNILSFPPGLQRLDPGVVTCQPYGLSESLSSSGQLSITQGSLVSTEALSVMQAVEHTERGALFPGRDGPITFLDYNTLTAAGGVHQTVQLTFGDNPGQIPFQAGPSLPTDDVDLYNRASTSRQNGITLYAENQASITTYGPATYMEPAPSLATTQAQQIDPNSIVSRYGTPIPRVDSLTVDMVDAVAEGLVTQLLDVDLFWAVGVERARFVGGAPSAFNGTFTVEQFAETVTAHPFRWTMQFTLAGGTPV